MSGRKFYYYGFSMHREFRNGEELLLQKLPYNLFRQGDVAAVLNVNKPYVHRIIRITPEGAVTQGDNNSAPDEKLLLPEDDFFLVTHAISLNNRTRRIARGSAGMVVYYQHQARRRLRSYAGKILRLLKILPDRKRP